MHDYVPLYFGSRSPMLYSVTAEQGVDQADLVYFEFPIILVERDDAVFTRASAHTISAEEYFADASDLNKLDWDAIDLLEPVTSDDDLRHRRMAELLVHWHLPLAAAVACVAYDEDAADKIAEITAGALSVPVTLEAEGHPHWFS